MLARYMLPICVASICLAYCALAAPASSRPTADQIRKTARDTLPTLQRRAGSENRNPNLGILTEKWGFGGCNPAEITSVAASINIVYERAKTVRDAFAPRSVLPHGLKLDGWAIKAITGQLRDQSVVHSQFEAVAAVTRPQHLTLVDDKEVLSAAGKPWILIACIKTPTPPNSDTSFGVDQVNSLLGKIVKEIGDYGRLSSPSEAKFAPAGLPIIEWLSLFPRHFTAHDSPEQVASDALNLEEALLAGTYKSSRLTSPYLLNPAHTIMHELFHSRLLFGDGALEDCPNGCSLRAILTQSGTLENNLKVQDAENQALLGFFFSMSPAKIEYIDRRLNIDPACMSRRSTLGSRSSGCSGHQAPAIPPVRPTMKQVPKSGLLPVQASSRKSLAAPVGVIKPISPLPGASRPAPVHNRPAPLLITIPRTFSTGQPGGKMLAGNPNLQAGGLSRARIPSKL